MMEKHGWSWGALVCQNLPPPRVPVAAGGLGRFSNYIASLPQWKIPKTERKESQKINLDLDKAEEILRQALDKDAEVRTGQVEYMREITKLFSADKAIAPPILLAQADTGIGKTLGYLIPAFLAAKQKGETTWITTYTRALQTQIAREVERLPEHKAAVRKGRENYICLLNFEEALAQPVNGVMVGLIARWISATQDGDIRSGDFPSWLGHSAWIARLTDSRETCIHSACRHFRSCFVEKQRTEAIDADIVIANHALVLSNAHFVNEDNPVNYIFDEGHHIFSVTDSAFSFHLTGQHMARCRQWLIGTSGSRNFAEQGLASRIGETIEKQPHIKELLDEVDRTARFLPQRGWRERITQQQALSVSENFLSQIYNKVWEKQIKNDEGYSLECDIEKLEDIKLLQEKLSELLNSVIKLYDALKVLDDNSLSSVLRVLQLWAEQQLPSWYKMSQSIDRGGLVQWIDRFVVERMDGQVIDVGMVRNALDPGLAFQQNVLSHARAALITSASLVPSLEHVPHQTWAAWQTGAKHSPQPPMSMHSKTSFDYAKLAKMFVITDLAKDKFATADAMAELFCVAGGGGLGLWTSKRRAQGGYKIIANRLEKEGLLLLSQHEDRLSLASLIDIFREEKNSCIIGTDALRDGIDVPGSALRLIVFEKTPWSRPDILHQRRRALFPKGQYDDMIVASRLQQAFGRLIRKNNDRGIFVLLDNRFPSRLKSALPKDLAIERLTLKETIEEMKKFYGG
jgi:ATP-dependent DNA helicase DinG